MSHKHIYTVGGTVQAGGGVYIPRRADEELLHLCQDGEFAYVLTSRQMGKSSLMVRAAEALAEEGTRSVIIDLTQLGVQVTAPEWYLGLLTTIEDALMLDTDVVLWWQEHDHLGVTNRLTLFFEEVLLKEIAENIVIFIDEIDSTLNLPFTDDFYAAIRFMYNARAFTPEFRRLSFVLVGVATPGDLISDSKRTPFNIGRRVDLTDFTFEEALPLANGLGLPPEEARLVLGWILKWTGGHPYLTQRTCRIVAVDRREHWTEKDIDRIVADTFLGDMSEQDNNLQFVRDMLTKRAPDFQAVLKTYGEIRIGRRPVRDEEQSLVKSHLKLSGAVKRQKGTLVMRNRIYAEIFNPRWVRAHLPFDEKRRRYQFVVMGVFLGVAVFVAVSAISLLLETFNTIQSNQATVEAVSATETLVRRTAVAREKATSTAQAREQATAEAAVASVSIQADLANSRRLAAEAINQLDEGDPDLALLLSLQANAITDTWEARSSLLTTLQRYPVAHPTTSLETPTGNIWSMAFNSNGSLLAGGSEDGTILIWNMEPIPELVKIIEGDGVKIETLTFSPDSKTLATGNDEGVLLLWDLEIGEPYYEFNTKYTGDISAIVFSPDGSQMIVGDDDSDLHYWQSVSTDMGDPETTTFNGAIFDLELTTDGETLVAAIGGQGDIVFIDSGTRRVTGKTIRVGQKVWDIEFSPLESTLIAGLGDYQVGFWDVATGRQVGEQLSGHDDEVVSVAYSPEGSIFASASWDNDDLIVWDAKSRRPLAVGQYGHTLIFSPDGKNMVSAGCLQWTEDACAQGSVQLWNIAPQTRADRVLIGHDAPIAGIAINPQEDYLLASADTEGTINFWDVRVDDQSFPPIQSNVDMVFDLAFHPDGKLLALSNSSNTAIVWSLESYRSSTTPSTAQRYWTSAVAFNPDGDTLATGSCAEIDGDGLCTEGQVQLWDANTLDPTGERFTAHTGWVNRLAFSPNGRTLVSGSEDGTLVWWTFEKAPSWRQSDAEHTSDVTSLVFHPDGKTLVTGSCRGTAADVDFCDQGEVIIWDTDMGEPKREPLALHKGWVTDITFSADGKLMASTSCNIHDPETGICTVGEVYLWDATTLQPMSKPLIVNGGAMKSAALSHKGEWLVAGDEDASLTVWNLDFSSWQEQACNLVSRNLSQAEWEQFIDPELPYEPTCANLPPGEGVFSPEQRSQ